MGIEGGVEKNSTHAEEILKKRLEEQKKELDGRKHGATAQRLGWVRKIPKSKN